MKDRTFSPKLIFLIAIIFVLPACSTSSPTPLPDPIEYSTFQEYKEDCSYVLDQDRPVMVTGELQLGDKTTCDRFGCHLELLANP